uniref:RING-type domain-containing protein n=1 Tax=Noctiluca scintillans TaxID=2966 RepID=A0A7S1AEH4_NOCSC|mmetsp:Transcript_42597/g.112407  ORF Transcript_42597/g.112407 Transcript_42597/m.112407 type:complete len:582 (+) Transcript_42597:49-1794(+)
MGRTLAWLSFASALRPLLGVNCDIRVDRPGIPGRESRAVPVPDAQGLAIVWQTDHDIFLQRYERDCTGAQTPVVVNSSVDMWHPSGLDGLGDAVSLGAGITLVSWTRSGHVWFVVVHGESLGNVTLASQSSGVYTKAEVRAQNVPGGFALIWSAWQKDGDGWGVFVRRFTDEAEPVGEEMQVNVQWRDFQWRPQLETCAGSLWAMWLNTSATCTAYNGCATGPWLRRFSLHTGTWDDEQPMNGTQPYAATLLCQSDGLVAFWNTYRAYHWFPVTVTSSSLAGVDTTGQLFLPHAPRSVKSSFDVRQAGIESRRLETVGDDLIPGETILVASSNHLARIANGEDGQLFVQLLDFALSPPMSLTPTVLKKSAQLSRAVWDYSTVPPTLVVCAVTGGVLSSEGKPAYECMRREVSSLHGSLLIGSFLSSAALACMFFLVCCFCCIKRCSTLDLDVLRRRRRPVRRLRLEELRQQLSSMPAPSPARVEQSEISLQETAARPAPVESTDASTHETPRIAPAERPTHPPPSPEADWCPICTQEVVIRVVFERCGHTACRDCALRMLDSDRKCYVCGNVVNGMLPVYL